MPGMLQRTFQGCLVGQSTSILRLKHWGPKQAQ